MDLIKDWKKLKRGYLFKQKTWYTKYHLGLDVICPKGTPIYAWEDLTVTSYMYGLQGGNTIQCKIPGNKRMFRLMHLLKPVKTGKYKKGSVLAYVGSTGALSTGAHLHIDISKDGVLNLKNIDNFEDPEKYFKASQVPAGYTKVLDIKELSKLKESDIIRIGKDIYKKIK